MNKNLHKMALVGLAATAVALSAASAHAQLSYVVNQARTTSAYAAAQEPLLIGECADPSCGPYHPEYVHFEGPQDSDVVTSTLRDFSPLQQTASAEASRNGITASASSTFASTLGADGIRLQFDGVARHTGPSYVTGVVPPGPVQGQARVEEAYRTESPYAVTSYATDVVFDVLTTQTYTLSLSSSLQGEGTLRRTFLLEGGDDDIRLSLDDLDTVQTLTLQQGSYRLLAIGTLGVTSYNGVLSQGTWHSEVVLSAVPEPSGLVLAVLGLAGVVAGVRRRPARG